MKLQSVI